MPAVLQFSFNAVAPILLLIALGYYGRRAGMLDIPSLKRINRFNFRFGFSALMFVNLYDVEEFQGVPWDLVGFLFAALPVLTAAGWAAARLATKERSRMAVLMMAAFRSNYAIIGLMLVQAVAGRGGVETASFMQLPTVLYFNVASVLILSWYAGSGQTPSPGRLLRSLYTNPLLQGLSAGAAALLLRQVLPGTPLAWLSLSGTFPWLYTTLSYLSRMSTPLALIVLGGQLEPREAGTFRRELIVGVAMRLVMAPAVGFALAAAAVRLGRLTLDAGRYAVLLAAFGSPMAVASVVMSAEMGSDDRLCGQLVVWTSLLGMISMFVLTAILRGLGLV